jgi:hypothetical protein
MNAKLLLVCSLSSAIVASQTPPLPTKPLQQDMHRERLAPLINNETWLDGANSTAEVPASPSSVNSVQSNAENGRVFNNTGKGCVCCALALCGVIIWGAVKLSKSE